MNWTTDDIFKLVKTLARKNQSGSISAENLFYTWNTEQSMYYKDIVGRWQARANGKQGANTGLIVNETILTELSPFTITETLTISGGEADKPDDFIYRLSLRINNKKVTVVRPDQLPDVIASVLDAPSTTNSIYYATEYEDYYSFLPNTVTTATLDYLAECTDIKWGYTFDSQGRQVYNAGTSVQPKWDKHTIIEITKRTLTNLGIGFKDADLTNYGRSAQITGN